MGLMPGKGLNKEEVKYRLHEKCATCMHFYYPSSCDLVDGNISSEAVCSKWEMKPRTEPIHKEFYQEEFEKAKKV